MKKITINFKNDNISDDSLDFLIDVLRDFILFGVNKYNLNDFEFYKKNGELKFNLEDSFDVVFTE